MSTTSIEWTEQTWNPTVGCEKVSAGCKECYAMKMAWRLMHIAHSAEKYEGVAYKTEGGQINWTGKVNLIDSALNIPLKNKIGTKYFVDSMSDVFHKDVPVWYIAKIWAIMYLADWHVFQVLTKRMDRAAVVLSSDEFKIEFHKACNEMHHLHIKPLEQELYTYDEVMAEYPLTNVILGASIENQDAWKERRDDLLNTPAFMRMISAEPLLSDLDLGLGNPWGTGIVADYLHWVVTGGESGTAKARPAHPYWFRSLREQCLLYDVRFFFKQWGHWAPVKSSEIDDIKRARRIDFYGKVHPLKGGNEIVRRGFYMAPVGKKKGGRELFGKVYSEMPII